MDLDHGYPPLPDQSPVLGHGAGEEEEDPVDLALEYEAPKRSFARERGPLGYEAIEAAGGEVPPEVVDEEVEVEPIREAVEEIRAYKGHRPRAAGGEAAGAGVELVIELGGHALDLLPRLGGDARVVVEAPGHRGYRDTDYPRDVARRHRHNAPCCAIVCTTSV